MFRCVTAARSWLPTAGIRLLGLIFLVGTALSPASAGTITVNWTDNSNNETGFKIERSTDGISFSEIATVGPDIESYMDAGLPDSTQFYYRVRATNAGGDSNFSNVAGGVTFGGGGNSAPSISAIANQTIQKNANTGALAFVVGDANTGPESLIVTATSSNTTLIPNANLVGGGSDANRTLTATPAANQTGVSTITVTVSDGLLSTNSVFTVTVNDVNAAPTISPVANQSINEDASTGALAFTIGDDLTPAGSLVVSGSSSNTAIIPNGNIVFGGSGANRTVTITPAANQNGGPVSITLSVSDGSLSNNAVFTVTVAAVNDVPTISSISNRTINEDTSTGAIPFTIGDNETPAGSLTVTATSNNTIVIPNSNITLGGSGSSRTISVLPALDKFGGPVQIQITVSDGQGGSANSSFFVTVTGINDAPTITSIANLTAPNNAPIGPIAFTVSDAETFAGGLTLTKASSNPTLLPLSNIVFGGSGSNRNVTLTPAAGQYGTVDITVTVSDGTLTANRSFTATITETNTAPTISDIANQTTNEDTSTGPINFVIGDAQSAAASLAVSATSSNQTLVPNGNFTFGGGGASRTLSVQPAANLFGTATITVTVSDGALSAQDTFLLTVNSANDAPSFTKGADQTTANTSGTRVISNWATALSRGPADESLQTLSFLVTNDNPGLFTIQPAVSAIGTLSYTPNASAAGTANVSVRIKDNGGTANGGVDTSAAQVLTVTTTAFAPTISSIASQTINEDSPSAALPFTLADADTPAGSLIVSASSSNQTLIPNGNISLGGSGSNRTVTVTPAANQNGGPTTITLNVTDGFNNASTNFPVTVTAVNDSPTISVLTNQSINQDTSTSPIAFTLADPDNPLGNLSLSATSSNVTLVPNANFVFGGSGADRTLTVTPAAGQTGMTSINVTVSDGTNSASRQFELTVEMTNAPLISGIANQTILQDSSTGVLPFTVSDTDTPTNSLTVSAASTNLALVPVSNIVLGGSGSDRTVSIQPAAGQHGTATITLTVNDGSHQSSTNFLLTVNSILPPTLGAISDQTISRDSSDNIFGFSIGDPDTPLGSLVLSGSSGNQSLIPDANIQFGGSGSSRTVSITPAPGATGTTSVSVEVSDGISTASRMFNVTIIAPQFPPTISALPDQVIARDGTSPVIPFTVTDPDTLPSDITILASSDNAVLVPSAGIILGGTGTNRTIQVAPAAGKTGAATITVTADDGGLTFIRTFNVTVTSVSQIPPFIAAQPPSIIALAGQDVAFNVAATGAGLTYQWYRSGGPIAGANGPLLVVNDVTIGDADTYFCTVSNVGGTVVSAEASLAVVNSTPTPGELRALSLRGNIGTGANAFFIGFALGNPGGRVLVKAVGPTLAGAPYNVPGAMVDPRLDLYAASTNTLLSSNDNWGGTTELLLANGEAGAFPLVNFNSKDAALLTTLGGGAFIAKASGVANTSGVTLVEFYGLDRPSNIQAMALRGRVGTGADVFFIGFVVEGTSSKTVLIKAVGPTLAGAPYNVPGALSNPTLDLHAAGTNQLIASNDDWGGDPQLTTANQTAGATPLANSTSRDGALLVTLPPGVYIATIAGANSTSGVVLAEIYGL